MRIAPAALLLCVSVAVAHAQAANDIVLKAMHDELDRSMQKLRLETLEKPYFISYRVLDSEDTNVSASFGALTSSSQGRSRRINVEVRVGNYELDNTNFVSFGFEMSGMTGVFSGNAQLPLDDDYSELRRQMWLATDGTYKKAVGDLARKKAALQNKVDTDQTPDFTKETPLQISLDAPVVHIDVAKWESTARSLSGLFRQMPDIYTSSVRFWAGNSFVRYVNSEGTSYTRREPEITFNARATTQAPDGTPLEDFVWLYARSLDELPSADELAARVRALGQRLKDIRTTSRIENYNGPVLVEGDAAPQVFEFVFVSDLLGVRRPLIDGQTEMLMQRNAPGENPFLDKIGARVLPDFLSVTDNPTLADFKGVRLAGSCKVDEDGVPTRETLLIENGILKTLLTTRDPVRGFDHSSGSRHAGQAAPSNVFVTTQNGLSDPDLRAKFLAMIKERNKDFGIVVHRMRTAQQPLVVAKLYLDGREEPIHGVQFAGLNPAAFKDIAAASSEENILTVSRHPSQNALNGLMAGVELGGEDEGSTPVSLAVPSFIFDDLTVHMFRGETPKLPVVPHPYFDSK
jgi:microcin-processing metallopeptidase PmbA/TldD-like protein